MNPIEEMMEKFGVKPLDRCRICGAQEFALGQCAEVDCEIIFPPFTPKKQLEIIKILSVFHNIEIFCGRSSENNEFYRIRISDTLHSSVIHKSLEYALAALLNKCFDTFAPTQRQQIKEILEG